MRKTGIITITLLYIALSTQAQLSNGLIAHWNFDGHTKDVSGNNYNGLPRNITYTVGRAGITNTAASFNGDSSNITIPYQASMNLTEVSICAVVKVNGYYSDYCQANYILARSYDHSKGHYNLFFSDNAYDGTDCAALDTSKHVFYSNFSNLAKNFSHAGWQYTPTIVSGQWYCVISTFANDTNRIYVNGTLVSTVKLPAGGIGVVNTGIKIGSSYNDKGLYPYWLDGDIDDLRLYNRALTPTEVADYCQNYDTLLSINDTSMQTICIGDTFSVAYTTNTSFETNNIFTAELSDANGNFGTPVAIGTITATTSDTIKCVIPSSVLADTGYQIRVVATNPVRTSYTILPVTIYNKQAPTINITATPQGPINLYQTVTYKANIGNAGNNPTFKWYRNGMLIPNANADSFVINTLNDGDSIYAEVTGNNPCATSSSQTSNVLHVKTTSINEINLPNLSISPNPNTGSFIIFANNLNFNKINLQIINLIGSIVYQTNVAVNDGTLNHQIDLPQASSGIYFLRLTSNGTQRNICLLVK